MPRFNPFTGTLDYVGGSTGGGGGDGQTWVTGQPLEPANGSRTVFSVGSAYISGSLIVWLRGIKEANITQLTSTTFEFSEAPLTGDTIELMYRTA